MNLYNGPDILYEVKGGCNATLEWTPVKSEALAHLNKVSNGKLYQLTRSTGTKTLLQQKISAEGRVTA